MNELLKKLKSLGVHIESAATLPKVKKSEQYYENPLNGEWVEQKGGRIFVVDEILPYGYSHGSINLQNSMDLCNIRYIQDNAALDEIKIDEIAFLDVETSSLSSGSGTLVFMVGVCYFGQSGIHLVQVFLDDPLNELVFINYLDNLLSKFELLVTYNGKTFDIPQLKTRFALNRVNHKFDAKAHIDLLTISRKIWKLRLESRTLSSIEQEILKMYRSQSEIPGWLVPQIYYDFLQTGDISLLKGVFYHNKMDILSLSALFQYIILLVSNDNLILRSEGLDIFSIACLLSPHIEDNKVISFFEKCIETGIPDENKDRVFRKIAAYFKKKMIWDKAIVLWEHNASHNDYFSCIELSKYYEHRIKDINKAVYWVEQAEILIEIKNNSVNRSDLIERKKRLLNKSGKINEKA